MREPDKPGTTPLTAVALRYDGTGAPRVTAKGRGPIAEEILARAAQYGIPLYEDAELVAALASLRLGEEIPEVLYRACAVVIAFAFGFASRNPSPTSQSLPGASSRIEKTGRTWGRGGGRGEE